MAQLNQKPFRVVLSSTQPDWGGGETYLRDLATELREQGVPVEFLAREGGSLQQTAEDIGFSVRPIRGRGKSLATIWKLRRWLAAGGPTVLHCNDSHALLCSGLAAWGLKNVRVTTVKHTMFPVRSALKYRWLAKRVICVSHAVADVCLEGGIAEENLRVIHSAMQPPTVEDAAVAQLRAELLPSAEHRLVVAIGNLVACKGHQTLLEAAALLKAHGMRTLTVIAGEGAERASLERRIESLDVADCVQLLGFRQDAACLTAAADVVVHPATEEGLGLSVAAALMLERPVVATAVGGLKEVLGLDPRMKATGLFGDVMSVGDADELARLLARRLATPISSPALEVAREYAVDRFGITRMTSSTLQLFEELWADAANAETESDFFLDSAA